MYSKARIAKRCKSHYAAQNGNVNRTGQQSFWDEDLKCFLVWSHRNLIARKQQQQQQMLISVDKTFKKLLILYSQRSVYTKSSDVSSIEIVFSVARLLGYFLIFAQ